MLLRLAGGSVSKNIYIGQHPPCQRMEVRLLKRQDIASPRLRGGAYFGLPDHGRRAAASGVSVTNGVRRPRRHHGPHPRKRTGTGKCHVKSGMTKPGQVEVEVRRLLMPINGRQEQQLELPQV